MASLSGIENRIGYRFVDRTLLSLALTHRSYAKPHNERLEFLGDSVLNFLVAKRIYEDFPDMREGEMSRLRANLVRQDTLHRLAEGFGLGGFLLLGEGELRSGGAERPSILADALEAIVAAVLLDGGMAAAGGLVARLYAPLLRQAGSSDPTKDPKTMLQEALQARRLALPRYELRDTRGASHAQEFQVDCVVEALGLRCIGIGSSRRAAEQQAARSALEQLPK